MPLINLLMCLNTIPKFCTCVKSFTTGAVSLLDDLNLYDNILLYAAIYSTGSGPKLIKEISSYTVLKIEKEL